MDSNLSPVNMDMDLGIDSMDPKDPTSIMYDPRVAEGLEDFSAPSTELNPGNPALPTVPTDTPLPPPTLEETQRRLRIFGRAQF